MRDVAGTLEEKGRRRRRFCFGECGTYDRLVPQITRSVTALPRTDDVAIQHSRRDARDTTAKGGFYMFYSCRYTSLVTRIECQFGVVNACLRGSLLARHGDVWHRAKQARGCSCRGEAHELW